MVYLSKEFIFEANDTQHKILQSMAYAASKLWNVGNYERRNYQDLGLDSFPGWHEQKKRLKAHYWFKALPSHTSQLILRQLHQAWESYFSLIKSGAIENPHPPRYKQKGIFIPFDAASAIKKEDGDIFRFTISKQEREFLREEYEIEDKYLCIKLSCFRDLENIKEIWMYPGTENRWKVIAFYSVPDVATLPDNGRYLSIDLGVKNFATVYTSDGNSFILGKKFVELNHYFNKKVAHYQSISDSQQVAKGVKYPKKSKRVIALYRKYNNSVKDLVHKMSAYIRDYCVANNINTVIVGDITGIRDGKDYGNATNQAFHALPYKKFTDKLAYKLALCGINLVIRNEAYSSQCSPFAPQVSKKYAQPENRLKRGLYKDGNIVLNADAVGAYNILRLEKPGMAFPVPYSTTKVSA